MAEFFFFTDPYLLDGQYLDQDESKGLPFGPNLASPSSTNLYNVASIHCCTSKTKRPKAYAICDSQIFIVETKDSKYKDPGVQDELNYENRLVDIILKPLVQTDNCPRIQYYVYRSILKSSVVYLEDISDLYLKNEIIKDDQDSPTDLTIAIRNASSIENPRDGRPDGIRIGLNNNGITGYFLDSNSNNPLTEDSYFDDLFYRDLYDNNGRIINIFRGEIKAGSVIGYFPKKDEFEHDKSLNYFGLEIILESPVYHPQLNYLNKSTFGTHTNFVKTHLIDVLGNDITLTDIKSEILKEEVLNYLDPAAFYGNFGNTSNNDILKLIDYPNSNSDASEIGVITVSSPDDIYNHILKGIKDNGIGCIFRNLKRVYIDIRDQYGFSINFFKDYYPKNLDIKWQTGDKYLEVSSSTQTRGNYPILFFDFSSGFLQPNNKYIESNSIELSIKFKKRIDNSSAKYTLFVHSGCLKDQELLTKFVSLNDDVADPPFLKQIVLRLINIFNSDSGKSFTYCQYIRLSLIVHNDEIPDTYQPQPYDLDFNQDDISFPKLRENEYLDYLWCPFDMRMVYDSSNLTSGNIITAYQEATYWNNLQADGRDYIANIGIAIENVSGQIFYTLFANCNESRYNPYVTDKYDRHLDYSARHLDGLSIFTSNNPGIPFHHTVESIGNNANQRTWCYVSRQFNSPLVTYRRDSVSLRVVSESGPGIEKFPPGFVSIELSKNDWDSLEKIYQNTFIDPETKKLKLPGMRVFLVFKNDGIFRDNGFQYTKFRLILRGFTIKKNKNNEWKLELIDVSEVDINNPLNNSSDHCGPVFHYVYYNSYNSAFNHDLMNVNGGESNSCYSIECIPDLANNDQMEENWDMSSNLYFARGIHLSLYDLIQMKKYVKKNIEEVFSSITNLGTWEATRYNGVPPYSESRIMEVTNVLQGIINIYNDPSLGLNIRLACPEDYKSIGKKKAIISVDKNIINSRSYATSRKTAMFYCSYRDGKENDFQRSALDIEIQNGNMAAHEFGHMLGLRDRYCFMGREYDKLVSDDSSLPVLAALFVQPEVDAEYCTGYKWRFNLMSFPDGVPENFQGIPFLNSTGDLESAFISEFENYKPSKLINNVKKAVFLTPKQWSHIKNYENETNIFGERYLFIKHLTNPPSTSNVFNGSFIGFDGAENDCTNLITDDRMIMSIVSISNAKNRYLQLKEDSPYTFYGWFDSTPLTNYANSQTALNDVISGGLTTLQRMIALRIIPSNVILRRNFAYDLTINNSDLIVSGDGDRYNVDDIQTNWGPVGKCSDGSYPNIFEDDNNAINNRGKDLWELEESNFLFVNSDNADSSDDIRYNLHRNRRAMILITNSSSLH